MAIDNVIYSKDGKTLFFCALDKTSVNILDGVTTIASNAFLKCYRLNSLVIPESVTTIESGAFGEVTYSYYGITSVTYISISYLGDGRVIDDYSNKLYDVVFENPNGWTVQTAFGGGLIILPNGSIGNSSNVISLSSEALSNSKIAAEYLKYRYSSYTWTRS